MNRHCCCLFPYLGLVGHLGRLFFYQWTHVFFTIHRLIMKRAASPTYFSSGDESDALLANALDEHEAMLHFSDNDDDDALVQVLDQLGGALPSPPLFAFHFVRVGQRRRWRNVVRGLTYRATLHQIRDARDTDNIGEALTEALRIGMEQQLRLEGAQPHDRVNFSITAHGFAHAFQTINFTVGEFLARTMRINTLLQTLADKLNSNESFEPDQGFEITMAIVDMPAPGRGKRKRRNNPGYQSVDKFVYNKKSIIQIKNKDALCCARAIVVGRAYCHKDDSADAYRRYKNLSNHYPIQGVEARALHQQAGVPEGPCGLEELQAFQQALGSNYQLYVVSASKSYMCIFKGDPAPHVIGLLYKDTHYETITKLPGFFSRGYYCTTCDKGYNTEEFTHHSCQGRVCKGCNRKQCPDYRIGTQPTTRCPRCNCLFFGADCLLFHQSGTSCGKFRKCPLCQSVYGVNPSKRHRCGFAKCPSCEEYVPIATHRCFIQPVDTNPPAEGRRKKKDPLQDALMVYADIEAMQLGDRSFEANMLCYTTSEDEEIHCLRGSNCVSAFIGKLEELTVPPANIQAEGEDDDEDDDDDDRLIFVIFHNLKGFDGNFLLRVLYQQCCTVETQLTIGAKVLSFKYGSITFKDSLCFLPMPLASFPKTFGITELKKGYFPHAFNIPANQSYVGRIPDEEFYEPQEMKDLEAKGEFERWHAEQEARNVAFNFQQEMENYCKSDVALLRAGCEAFCAQFEPIAGFNPFTHSFTIAGACNLFWRRSLLEPDTIAVRPFQGWRGARVNQSKVAFQWLYFLESQIPKEGAAPDRIRHARNGGEQKVVAGPDSFFVDGYDPVTQTVYEFHGCRWHGCRSCFPRHRDIKSAQNPDRTFTEMYDATLVKMQTLRNAGYRVVEMWECQWAKMVKNPLHPAHAFVKSLTLPEPLVPREAFFGGRTGAVSLYAIIDERLGELIRYLDVTSLYPWVNKTATYPIGHPQIITNPSHLDIGRYFGLALVDILPPEGLFHPVLPVRAGGKLTFPLCGTCVGEQQALPFLERTDVCSHTDAQRALRGTWCTPEIMKAIEKGYRLLQIHEVWHFPPCQQRTGLFAEYVNTWLKIKQESAGWPGWCTDEAKKQQYLDQYKEREGIELDPQMVSKNAGRKATAKLMLNSFWGKFGERENKPQTEAVYEPHDLYSKLTNPLLDVSQMRMCTEDLLEVVFRYKDENVTPSNKTNIFVAAFTTCWARLKLYSYLDVLGERVLYYDTDSVIYRQLPDQPTIAVGDFLGDMTDELEGGDHIVEFVSGGAKNYGYKTQQGKVECKVKGFKLNVRGRESLNYEVVKRNVLAELDDPQEERRVVPVVNPNHFKRDQASKKIGLVQQRKQYGLVFDKRVVNPGTRTSTPYGYRRVTSDIHDLLELLDSP